MWISARIPIAMADESKHPKVFVRPELQLYICLTHCKDLASALDMHKLFASSI